MTPTNKIKAQPGECVPRSTIAASHRLAAAGFLVLFFSVACFGADRLQRIGVLVGGVSGGSTKADYYCLDLPCPQFRIDQILTNGFITRRVYWFGRDSDLSRELLAFIECDSSKLCLKDKWSGRAIDCGTTNINNEQMHYLKVMAKDTNTTAVTVTATNAAPVIVKRAGSGMKNTDIYTPHKKLGQQ